MYGITARAYFVVAKFCNCEKTTNHATAARLRVCLDTLEQVFVEHCMHVGSLVICQFEACAWPNCSIADLCTFVLLANIVSNSKSEDECFAACFRFKRESLKIIEYCSQSFANLHIQHNLQSWIGWLKTLLSQYMSATMQIWRLWSVEGSQQCYVHNVLFKEQQWHTEKYQFRLWESSLRSRVILLTQNNEFRN